MDRAALRKKGSQSDFAVLCTNDCFVKSARALSAPIFGVTTLNALVTVKPGLARPDKDSLQAGVPKRLALGLR